MEGHERPQPIRSSFSDDPEMRELVAYFIDDLGRRVESMRAALDAEDARELRRLAHQLAGAAGGYGYESIGAVAREVDDGLAHEMALSDLSMRAEALIELCRRAIPPVAAAEGAEGAP